MSYPKKENGALYRQSEAEAFAKMLFRNVEWEDGQLVSILGIGEKGTAQEGKFRERKIIAPAFMGAMHSHLKRWAEHEVASYIVPAVLHASAKEAGDVTLDKLAALTAIILDIDSGDVTEKAKWVSDRLGRPSMIVASGGKTDAGKLKAHLYWLFDEPCEDVERVAAIRKLLAAKVGGDQSFGRATQVIRVPGSVHAKNGNASVCHILDQSTAEYSFEALAEIVEDMQPIPGCEEAVNKLTGMSVSTGPVMAGGLMDFMPRQDTAIAALHRDIDAGGDELTRFSEFSKVAGFHIAEARAGRMTLEAAYLATNGWMLAHMNPPWPAARVEQEFRALLTKDVQNHGPIQPAPAVVAVTQSTGIEPTPASWPLSQSIPPRPWIFGRWLQRGIVTAVVAPGGVGKSALMTAMTLSISSGRPILGKDVYGGPLRTWYWNLEDSADNLARSRIGASLVHGIKEAECGGRMFVDSGPEGAMLCTAVEDRNGFTILEPVYANVIEALKRQQIDVLVIDPFVSSHGVNENDNTRVDAVVKMWAWVAKQANCALVLVHHAGKLRGDRVTAESARGASALNNAARVTLVLNRMTPEQGEVWGIDPVQAQRFFNVADDKHNLSPAEGADWFELKSVCLNNAVDDLPADNVGVVTRWKPPSAMDGVHAEHLFKVQRVIHAGTYWRNSKVKEFWAGEVVAEVMGWTLEPADQKRINQVLERWIATGALKIETMRDDNRKLKEAVKVGNWAGDPNAFKNYCNDEGIEDDG